MTINQQSWHRTWWALIFSVFVFPMFPAFGALGLFIVSSRIWLQDYRQIITNRLNQALGILTILLLLSCLVAEHSSAAWLGLANLLPFFWLFMAIRALINQPCQLKQLSWAIVLPSLPIVVLGFGQLFAAWQTPSLLGSILGWELIPQGVPPGRMSSVFIYTNFLAIYLAIALTLGLGLWLDTWQTKNYQRSAKQVLSFIFLTTILIADLGGLVLTSSRNAWGLAIICLLAYAFYLGWRWLVWGVTGAASVILWASFAPNWGGTQLRTIVPTFFWERLSDTIYDRPVETLRITQWQFCWELIQQRPWFGWGLRNFSILYQAAKNYWFGHPHSLFLMLAAETGLLATLVLIVIVGLIIYQGSRLLLVWSRDRDRLIYFSYLLTFVSCVLFNLLDVTIFDLRVNTIIWLLLSAISGIVQVALQINRDDLV